MSTEITSACAVGYALALVLMIFWLADLTSRSCRFERLIKIKLDDNVSQMIQSGKAPRATTKSKVQFVFGTELYFTTDNNVSRASLSEKSELKIPQGAVFEVRKSNSSEVLFRMIVQNHTKMTAFKTWAEYQTAPNTHPVWMKEQQSVSVYIGTEPVQMCLHTGLTYQKVVNGIKLVDTNGYPFIDTLERDIEAYLIGPDIAIAVKNEPTCKIIAVKTADKIEGDKSADKPIDDKFADDKSAGKAEEVIVEPK